MSTDGFIVSEVFRISGRGTGLFFEGSPPDIAVEWGAKLLVVVQAPGGTQSEYLGQKEFVRTDRTDRGEMVALVLANAKPTEIKIGSKVQLTATPLVPNVR